MGNTARRASVSHSSRNTVVELVPFTPRPKASRRVVRLLIAVAVLWTSLLVAITIKVFTPGAEVIAVDQNAAAKNESTNSQIQITEEKIPLAPEMKIEIPVGFRAISLPVKAMVNDEQLLKAETLVDLQWIGEYRGESITRKLADGAKILSIDRDSLDASQQMKVSLLVSDLDAQRITLAETAGTFVLSLRGVADVTPGAATNSISMRDLLGRESQDVKKIEGIARIRESNGSVKEYAIVDGSVMKRSK